MKTAWKIQRKSWSNVPPRLLVCTVDRISYKVVHKIGRLNPKVRKIKINFLTAWNISMK